MKKLSKIVLLAVLASHLILFLNSQTTVIRERFYFTELFTLKWGNQEGEVGLLKGPDRFYGPRSFDIDEASGRVIILDSENGRVSIFDINGNAIYSIIINERADEVLLSKNQTLFILNCSSKSIKELNLKGQILAQYLFSGVAEPIIGINIIKEYPAIVTSDGKTITYFSTQKELRTKYFEPELKETIHGKVIDNKSFAIERQSPQKGVLKIYSLGKKLEKEITILPQEGNIETLNFLGLDNDENIYLVVEETINPGWRIKRFLKKLNQKGELLAQALLPYSNYAFTFRDLNLSSSGKVYQMLPLEKGLTVLAWSVGPASYENESYEDTEYYLEPSLNENVSVQEIEIPDQPKENKNYNLMVSAISPDNILYRAQQYANLTFYVSSNNITPSGGVSCGGKTVETDIRTPGGYIGVPYKWGGFSGITGITSYTDCGYNFVEGLNAGLYAGDKNTNTSYGSCCAVGVDCSGFVSQCWGLSSKYSTSTIPDISFRLFSYDFLEQGDALNYTSSQNYTSSHVMLFLRREADGRITVYESSAWDWKVSSRSYYTYQISSYYPYRYIQYSAPNKFSSGTRVQVATSENLAVRSSYSRSATQLYSVTYPAAGTVIEGPVENEGFLWVKVQWDSNPTPGWCNSAPLAKSQPDTVPPTISSFDVNPKSITLGSSFTITYTVSDSGGSGLSRIELWRAVDVNGSPSNWTQVQYVSLSGNGPISGSFTDTPSSPGSYWYGLHALDNSGNMGVEPSPIKVIVSSTQSFTISGYVRTSSGIGISGVVMNGLPGNPSTDSNGYYSGTVPYGWSGTVTPTKSGYTFSPSSTTYSNVTSNQTTNYTGSTQSFIISGYVRTSTGTGISGVVMNGLPGNPSTDSNGYYSGTVPYGWSGTVTPTKSGYTFSPSSTTYSNVTSNQTTNYTGSTQSFTISGYVRTSSGSGISGVVMNGLPGNPSTDSNGYYSGTVPYGWSGTVTPTKSGYTFSPSSSTYSNVTSNQTTNYTGSTSPDTIYPTILSFDVTPKNIILGGSFTISYTVSDSGGSGLNRVELYRTIDINGSPANWWHKITYNSLSGDGPVYGSFTDSPSSAGSYWYDIYVADNANNLVSSPSQIKVTVSPLQSFTISGYVRTSSGTGISGVVMNGLPGNPSTDSNGYYSGTVPYGWSGTVTPTKSGYTFSPSSTTYSNVTSNQTTNYTGSTQSFTISGYVRTSSGSGISGVVMNGLPGNPSTDSNGYYSGTVPYGWSGTVTPTKSGYTFSPSSTTYSNVTSNQTTNYTGSTQSFIISGYVRTSTGTGISGVVMNGLPSNPSTDSNGYYSGTVPYGWSGTVTPTKSGYTFSPSSTTYSNVTSNQTTNYTGSITDTNAYPPKNLSLQRLINNFIFFKEYINRLSWQANDQNIIPVIKYRIYAKIKGDPDANYKIIAEVPASSFQYDHRYLKINDYYSYRITAINDFQNESTFVEISN